MKRIPTEEAKEQFLELIDQLDDEGIVITKGGQVVATLTKYQGKSADLIGYMKDEIEVRGDIIDVRDRWKKGRQW